MTSCTRSLRSDRGSATTQLVLVVPALLLLSLTVVQFALLLHARHIADFAAQRALAAARTEHGTATGGRAQASRSLAAVGGKVLLRPRATVTRTATRTTVHVQGVVMAVVPFLALHASGSASGPTERLTLPAGARP